MDWQPVVAERLFQLRRANRLNQETVAAAVNMHVTDLSKLERGKRPQITFDVICRLAAYYGVSVDDLCDPARVYEPSGGPCVDRRSTGGKHAGRHPASMPRAHVQSTWSGNRR